MLKFTVDMRLIENVEAPFLVFNDWTNYKEITHFITTRRGGVSKGIYSSLNIGFGNHDDPDMVLKNRQIMAHAVDIPLESFVMLNQVHGVTVAMVTANMKGFGALNRESAIGETDAMITNEPGICLFIMTADCVPLLFFDPVKRVISVAHAGWRGTVKKIAMTTVLKMHEIFGCDYADIMAGIGPSIGPCCYSVGGEVIDSVLRYFRTTDEFISFGINDSLAYFDLWHANKTQLLEAGLRKKNISMAGICTNCHHEDFFSSRHDKGMTGRFGAGIMIK